MIKKILVGSIIAVAIIILASFSSVVGKVSSDDELVEFDIEFCGLGKKQTIQLTQNEADEVELLFDDIKEQLNKVETRDEAEIIFKDAIVELDKYGLLGGLSVKQAQNLVTDKYQDSKGKKLLEKYYSKNQSSQDINGNLLCLIAGKTSGTAFFSIFFKFFGFIQKMIFDDYSNPLIIPVFITLMISIYSPFAIGADIVFLPNAEGWLLPYVGQYVFDDKLVTRGMLDRFLGVEDDCDFLYFWVENGNEQAIEDVVARILVPPTFYKPMKSIEDNCYNCHYSLNYSNIKITCDKLQQWVAPMAKDISYVLIPLKRINEHLIEKFDKEEQIPTVKVLHKDFPIRHVKGGEVTAEVSKGYQMLEIIEVD